MPQSPEVKKLMTQISRAKSHMLDAMCRLEGFPETQPFLRKTFRQALRDRMDGKKSPEREFILIFMKVRREASVVGLTEELGAQLDNALLDLFNAKPQAVRYQDPRLR